MYPFLPMGRGLSQLWLSIVADLRPGNGYIRLFALTFRYFVAMEGRSSRDAVWEGNGRKVESPRSPRPPIAEQCAIIGIAWEIGFAEDIVISTVAYSTQEFASGPLSCSPLVREIQTHGYLADAAGL